MLDITKMLHQIIDLELKIDDEKELMIGPETRKQTIFVDLDISLSNGFRKGYFETNSFILLILKLNFI